MKETPWIVDANFVVPGFGLTGAAQPTNTDRSKFISDSSLDTAIATVHAAKDLPSLTMNDKVFAARYTVAVTVPRSVEAEVESEPEPEPEPEAPAEEPVAY